MERPVEVRVEEDTEIVARVAAIDVAKASGMVCTRVPQAGSGGRRVTQVWEVKATVGGISELAQHLVGVGVERVVLESTSDYWRPFYYLLEAAGLVVWLVNARAVKNVPGRPKTDRIDAVWLAKLAERSMLSPSFVPAPAMRQVRELARARFDLVGDRTRVKQRVEKLLEDALIKVSSVLADLHGVSGRAMLEALIAGERNPTKLAGLARGRARARLGPLAEALEGRFTDHHARLTRLLLDQIDDLSRRIDTVTGLLDQAIAALPAPTGGAARVDPTTGEILPASEFTRAVDKIAAIPGAGPHTARAVIGEIGTDMTVFASPARLCSWAKVIPRTVQSGPKTRKGKLQPGNPYLKAALGQIAAGAADTDTFLGARYRRLAKRMPKAKAHAALQRSILTIIYHLLADPTATYTDLGADHYTKRIDTQRRTRHLVNQLQALGHHVTLTPAP